MENSLNFERFSIYLMKNTILITVQPKRKEYNSNDDKT